MEIITGASDSIFYHKRNYRGHFFKFFDILLLRFYKQKIEGKNLLISKLFLFSRTFIQIAKLFEYAYLGADNLQLYLISYIDKILCVRISFFSSHLKT